MTTNCEYPLSLADDELGQKVYDSLRTPLTSTMTTGISDSARLRLERAAAYLAARPSLHESAAQPASQETIGKIAIQNIALPAYATEEL